MKNENISPKKIQQLLSVSIVQKLKQIRGLNQVKRLANYVQQVNLQFESTIINQDNQTYLILLIEGRLQASKTKNNQVYTENINKNQHYLVQKNVIKLRAQQDSIFYILKEKYIIQTFQGIISLPFITLRLKQLRKNQIFQNMEKRKLVKIAFDLQQLNLSIGSKLFTEIIQQEEVKNFCYYIINGEIKIFRQNFAICVLGSKQIFGIPELDAQLKGNLKISIGKTITEKTHVYKIPTKIIEQSGKFMTEYLNKRIRWRQNRLNNIGKIQQSRKKKSKLFMKQKASFIDKEIVMKSLYGNKIDDLVKLKYLCTNSEIKCESRQQFYSKKLDKIKQIQKSRYGSFSQILVLFPYSQKKVAKKKKKTSPSINRIKNMCLTQSISESTSLNATRKYSFLTNNL